MALITSRQVVNVLQPLVAAQFRSWASRVGGTHPAVSVQLNNYANQVDTFDARTDDFLATIGDWYGNLQTLVRQYEDASPVSWASYTQQLKDGDVIQVRLWNNLTNGQRRWYRLAVNDVRGTSDEGSGDTDPRVKRVIKQTMAACEMVEAFIMFLEDGNPLPVLPE